MQCLGGDRYYFCTNTLIVNNDEKQNRKLAWHFNRILVTSDTLTKFCMNLTRTPTNSFSRFNGG